MNKVVKTTALLGVGIALASTAAAQTPRNRPELFNQLLDCRVVTDDAQRLACYDRSVGALEEAEKKKDLVVVDRKEIRETKKSLFGFTLPKIGLFTGDKDDDKDEVEEISSTVETARMVKGGDWSLRLAGEAGTWETNSSLKADPRPGDTVRIKKASLGSYLGQVGISRGVRFRRVQ